MRSENRIELSWINQPGRSRMESYADGFTGSTAIASVVAIAENVSRNSGCAGEAVAVIRDSFAEGAAYGIVDVLQDSIDEIEAEASKKKGDSCSFAAAAVMGEEVWVYSTGSCRTFLVGNGNHGSKDVMDLSSTEIKHIILKPGQSVILVTNGLRKLMESSADLNHSLRCGKPLSVCISGMVKETRIRFRKKGASAAAIRLCKVNSGIPGKIIGMFLFISAVISILFIFCRGGRDMNTASDRSDSNSTVVMPLN